MVKINPKLFADTIYPIGSIIIKSDNADYSNWLGFTWERTLVGRVAVGIDSNDTDFDTIGKTGGSKELQEHTHTYNISTQGTTGNDGRRLVVWNGSGSTYDNASGAIQNTGTGDSGNLQPYQVVAYWKRVS